MAKDNQVLWAILGIVAIILLARYSHVFSIVPQDTTYYSGISVYPTGVVLSNPNSPAYFQTYQSYANPILDDFRTNKILLPLYLNQLNVNQADFNVITISAAPNCVLTTNYCLSKPSGDLVSSIGIDKNSCPIWTVSQRTSVAYCYQGRKLTYVTSCTGPGQIGCLGSGWYDTTNPGNGPVSLDSTPSLGGSGISDCSTYSVTNPSYGGPTDSKDRSAEISTLLNNSWYYDNVNNCLVGGAADSVFTNTASHMSCYISGNSTDRNGIKTGFQYNGITSFSGNYGFTCQVTGNFNVLPTNDGSNILISSNVNFVLNGAKVAEYPSSVPAQNTTQNNQSSLLQVGASCSANTDCQSSICAISSGGGSYSSKTCQSQSNVNTVNTVNTSTQNNTNNTTSTATQSTTLYPTTPTTPSNQVQGASIVNVSQPSGFNFNFIFIGLIILIFIIVIIIEVKR